MIKKIRHAIAHFLGMNYGKPDSFYQDDKLMMSFLCTGCRERSSIHPIDGVIDREIKEGMNKHFAKHPTRYTIRCKHGRAPMSGADPLYCMKCPKQDQMYVDNKNSRNAAIHIQKNNE